LYFANAHHSSTCQQANQTIETILAVIYDFCTKHEDANSNCPYPLGATSKCKLQDQIELSVIKLELEEHFIVQDSEALKVVRTMPTAFNSHIQLQADIIKEIPI